MKSPFPGMDPYLEQHWGDVHSSLLTYARDQLQPKLPDDLVARTNERLVVDAPFDDRRAIFPDVRVVEHPARGGEGGGATATAVAEELSVVAEPLLMRTPGTEFRQGYIEIREARGEGRLVTAIEFLSPTNKVAGDGRRKYRQKRQEFLGADANLVEIDLTRSGRRQLLVPQSQIPPSHQATYQACAYAAWGDGVFELYAMPLAQRLPKLALPLRKTDRRVVLDVQAIVDAAYAAGRYDRTLDYGQPCRPPLKGAEAEWAESLLKAAGRR